MKKIIHVLCLTLFMVSFVVAQETNNWYFGSAAGFANTGLHLYFPGGGSPVVSTCIPMLTEEGTSAISDPTTGAPLFYTDGVTVYDGATNAVLPGGTGLNGGSSSAQSAIIMPMPGSTTKWLLFTSGVLSNPGTYYYTVTGTTSTGPFSVSAGTQLAPANTVGEGLFIIGSTKVGSSFWVVARDFDNVGGVRAWDVSNAGVVNATPVLSNLSGAGFTNTSFTSHIGTIKSNTCQNQLAFTYLNGDVDITGFNTATGQVTATAKRINVVSGGGNSGSYGLEFSSNDSYLYITNLAGHNVYSYNISTTALTLLGTVPDEAGQLQMGPNGVIYMARMNGAPAVSYLGTITSPSTGGVFTANGLLLTGVSCGGNTGFSYRGLPTFPKSLVVSKPIINPGDGTYCTNTAIPLSFTFAGSIDASGVTWTQTGTGGTFTPGGATSTSLSPSITFTTTGAKTVTLTFNDACGRPYTATINLTIISPKVPAGTITCSGSNNVTLNATGTVPGDYPNYVWYDAPSGGNIVGVGNPVNLLYPNTAAVPANFYVEVGGSVTVTSSGTNQSIASPASLTWAANPANYTVTGINVLANSLSLKSITVRPYNGTANGIFSVTIKQGATTISTFNYNVGPSYVNGNTIVVPINQTLLQGSGYSIQLNNVSGMSGGWWGGSWAGATNANQITYPAQGAGTNGVFALVYDYQNYTTTTTCSSRVLVTGTCTLPVEWLSTVAQREGDHVVVNWSLASQTNNQKFEVQRSLDGVNFETVGVLPGKGTNNAYSAYEFVDFTNEKGALYYRIVQYDYDGKSTTSSIAYVDPLNSQNEFELYPNPTNGQITLTLLSSDETAGQMVVSVLNSLGQEVFGETLNASSLSSGLAVDLSALPQGAYLVKVTTSKGEWIEHLIKK